MPHRLTLETQNMIRAAVGGYNALGRAIGTAAEADIETEADGSVTVVTWTDGKPARRECFRHVPAVETQGEFAGKIGLYLITALSEAAGENKKIRTAER